MLRARVIDLAACVCPTLACRRLFKRACGRRRMRPRQMSERRAPGGSASRTWWMTRPRLPQNLQGVRRRARVPVCVWVSCSLLFV